MPFSLIFTEFLFIKFLAVPFLVYYFSVVNRRDTKFHADGNLSVAALHILNPRRAV
jgi:hypothetical protein